MEEIVKEELIKYIKTGLIKAGKLALLAGAAVFVTEFGTYLQIVPEGLAPESVASLALLSGMLLYIGGYLKTRILSD